MIHSDGGILFSAIAVFAALAGIAASIRGVLFDEPSFFRCGGRRCVLRAVARPYAQRRHMTARGPTDSRASKHRRAQRFKRRRRQRTDHALALYAHDRYIAHASVQSSACVRPSRTIGRCLSRLQKDRRNRSGPTLRERIEAWCHWSHTRAYCRNPGAGDPTPAGPARGDPRATIAASPCRATGWQKPSDVHN